MRRVSYSLLALALISSTAIAQRGGGGGGDSRKNIKDANWDDLRSQSSTGLRLSNGDVEDMDPVKRLVDKRRDLKLTDDQQKQMKDMMAKSREATKPNYKTLDSLRQAMRPMAGLDADAEQARQSMTRESVMGTVVAIRGVYDASLKDALALLDDGQKTKADEVLKKLAEDTDETMKNKLGGRGAGGGGRRGGRPPQ
jgi:hypothetical protein